MKNSKRKKSVYFGEVCNVDLDGVLKKIFENKRYLVERLNLLLIYLTPKEYLS